MMGPRAFLPALALVGLLTVPVSAQVIPAGNDYWVTYGTGSSYAEIPFGELEALCGLAPDPNWNRIIRFQGVPVAGDADTVVARLGNASLPAVGSVATVEVQVRALRFASMGPTATPCGPAEFKAGLVGAQPITRMTITRTSKTGGFFNSDLIVNIEIIAHRAGNPAAEIGRLYYTFDLPDPGSTPWTFAGALGVTAGGWLPAVSPSGTPGNPPDCWAVARAKVVNPPYQGTAAHEYYIAQYQAQGICPPPPR